MKRPVPRPDWPESWKDSYAYDLQEVYGEVSRRGYGYAYQDRRKTTLDMVCAVLPKSATVLDVAAAQGNFTLTLAEMGYRVTWNDLRGELAEYVQLKHEHGYINYSTGNIFDLRVDEPFDAVLITEVIEHVAHPDQFLERVAELVRPGGYVVMTTPNGRYFRNTLPRFSSCEDPAKYEKSQFKPNSDGHIFLLHPDEVWSLAAKAGLDVDAFSLFTNSLTSGHIKMEALLAFFPESVVHGLELATRRLPRRLKDVALVQMAARFRKPER
jgi:2-polyprenyl-6-hydroxyphenyl methylase/3-demethylubiquinone-9 3-methyltransferase